MKKIVLGLALLGCPVVAHAQDGADDAWSGPYIGVEGGMDNYELSAEGDLGLIDPEFSGLDASFDGVSGDGVAGAIYAGYQMGFAGGFVGIEGFLGYSDASMDLSVTDGVDTVSLTAEARESYGIAARVGAKVSRSTAIYARGGWINTNFRTAISDGVDTFSSDETEDGIQYGAGLESMIGSNIAIRAEYVFNDYDDAGFGEGINVDNGSFRAGLTYRF